MSTTKKRKKTILISILAATMMLSLLSACTKDSNEGKIFKPSDSGKIKVMYFEEQFFLSEFGNVFQSKFPNVEIEVVNMRLAYESDSYQDFLDEHKPDVLMLDMDTYEKLAQEGKLVDLDSLIKRDNFDIEGVSKPILKNLRDKGGSLFGLSPTFNSSALYYNIDLFQKYGVDIPTDSMSWEEVLQLAALFPKEGSPEEQIYGLSPNENHNFMSMLWDIGAAYNLNVASSDGKTLTVDSDSWRNVYDMVVQSMQSRSISLTTDTKTIWDEQAQVTTEYQHKRDLFLSGRSAMTINTPYYMQIFDRIKQQVKDAVPVNWGIVTSPVDPNNRNQSTSTTVDQIFAINAGSSSIPAAWELVKYMNSEEFAKQKSKSTGATLLTRTEFISEKDGKSLEPFFKLEPGESNVFFSQKLPNMFYDPFSNIIIEEIKAVMENTKTIDEAVSAIQTRGQEALDTAWLAEKPKEEAK